MERFLNTLRNYHLVFLFAVLVAISSLLVFWKLIPQRVPPYWIYGMGTIDGDLVSLNTQYPGRVLKILKDEGESFKKGEILAVLDSKEYREELKAALEGIKSLKEEIEAKKTELVLLEKNLPLEVEKAEEKLKALRAKLEELKEAIEVQKAVLEQTKREFQRVKKLFEKNLTSKENYERAELKVKVESGKLKELQKRERELLNEIGFAEKTLQEAKNNLQKIEILKREIETLKHRLGSLRAKAEKLRTIIGKLTLKAPFKGYVVDKVAQEGEFLGAGFTVLTLIDPDRLYLKMFVNTLNVGKIKIGDPAVIFLDAYPDKPIRARVAKIAKRAEFTPKEVAVREERIHRVYAVYLKPLKPSPLLKLGLPALGVISVEGKKLPKSLKELPPL